ncbi:uncharacterized protein LOC106721589 [Papilio machaon]|uniref:uncharacterized protein LOC106721589 n=1 Tax=Papilio machaon TaxID=76193 RepID=UPI001E6645B3|nr:uncharacterized protein LOC106721589 [Papilio machaon]
MACNYCYEPFCLFRVEERCPSCGFSYCVRCLDNKIFVKQLNAEKKVCVKCLKYNSSGEVHMIPPPDHYRKVHRKKKPKSKSCENHNDNETNPDNIKSSNVSNKNGNVADENSPSTSYYHGRIDYYSSENESNSEKSGDEDNSDDLSEESEDEINDEDIEKEKSLIFDLKDTHPHLYDGTRHVKKETKSTDEILRDAIRQLHEGFHDMGEKLEAYRKKPPKCTLCSTKALVNCKGCESTFCMRCFDMHSDEVCVEYETLELHVN